SKKFACRKVAYQALDEELSLLFLPMGEVLRADRKPAFITSTSADLNLVCGEASPFVLPDGQPDAANRAKPGPQLVLCKAVEEALAQGGVVEPTERQFTRRQPDALQAAQMDCQIINARGALQKQPCRLPLLPVLPHQMLSREAVQDRADFQHGLMARAPVQPL